MTEKDLRKLNKIELLKLLLEMSREKERLEAELEDVRAQLNDRRIILERSGSIAEAALKLNNIFETAQRAADLFLENIVDSALNNQSCEKKKL